MCEIIWTTTISVLTKHLLALLQTCSHTTYCRVHTRPLQAQNETINVPICIYSLGFMTGCKILLKNRKLHLMVCFHFLSSRIALPCKIGIYFAVFIITVISNKYPNPWYPKQPQKIFLLFVANVLVTREHYLIFVYGSTWWFGLKNYFRQKIKYSSNFPEP